MMNMPAVVGPVQLGKITFGGAVGFGDRMFITPQSSNKTFTGSGVLNTANFASVENLFDINTDFAPSGSSMPNVINN